MLLGFMITGIFLSGCAHREKNLITQKGVSIEAVGPARAHLYNIAISEDNNELVITGKVHRHYRSISGSGHIDVTILNSSGSIIERGGVAYTPTTLPKTPGARNHRGSLFEVRLTGPLPEGSKVQVAYHATVKPGKSGLDCGRSVSTEYPSVIK